MVNVDAILWERAIVPARFRYERREGDAYWSRQVRWERRRLSALELFVPYHLCIIYNMKETARDRLCVRIPLTFKALEVCHGFLYEQEPFFRTSQAPSSRTGTWVFGSWRTPNELCAFVKRWRCKITSIRGIWSRTSLRSPERSGWGWQCFGAQRERWRGAGIAL